MPKHKMSSYFNAGPLATILMGDPKARILDQAMLIGNGEFTVSTIAEGTDLTYKTVKEYLRHLQELGFVETTRQLGNAQAYRFNMNHMNALIQFGTQYQQERKNA